METGRATTTDSGDNPFEPLNHDVMVCIADHLEYPEFVRIGRAFSYLKAVWSKKIGEEVYFPTLRSMYDGSVAVPDNTRTIELGFSLSMEQVKQVIRKLGWSTPSLCWLKCLPSTPDGSGDEARIHHACHGLTQYIMRPTSTTRVQVSRIHSLWVTVQDSCISFKRTRIFCGGEGVVLRELHLDIEKLSDSLQTQSRRTSSGKQLQTGTSGSASPPGITDSLAFQELRLRWTSAYCWQMAHVVVLDNIAPDTVNEWSKALQEVFGRRGTSIETGSLISSKPQHNLARSAQPSVRLAKR